MSRSGRHRGRPGPAPGTRMASSSASSCGLSPAWPGVSRIDSGRPRPSQTRWLLQLSPPRERPSACSPGSRGGLVGPVSSAAGGIVSFDPAPCVPQLVVAGYWAGAGGVLMGPHHRAVRAGHPVQLPGDLCVGLRRGQQPIPGPVPGPAVQPLPHRLPWPEHSGRSPPRRAGPKPPSQKILCVLAIGMRRANSLAEDYDVAREHFE